MTRWLDGLEERARQTVPPHILEYVLQGAGDPVTAFEAPASWAAVRLAPRVLRDVTQVDLPRDRELAAPLLARAVAAGPGRWS